MHTHEILNVCTRASILENSQQDIPRKCDEMTTRMSYGNQTDATHVIRPTYRIYDGTIRFL